MPAALALLPVILQYLPMAITGAEKLVAWIQSIRSAAQQAGQWTDAQEAQYIASLTAAGFDPAWQPDPPKA